MIETHLLTKISKSGKGNDLTKEKRELVERRIGFCSKVIGTKSMKRFVTVTLERDKDNIVNLEPPIAGLISMLNAKAVVNDKSTTTIPMRKTPKRGVNMEETVIKTVSKGAKAELGKIVMRGKGRAEIAGKERKCSREKLN